MPQYLPSRRPGRTAEKSLAEVAELADAHGSGPCTRKGVGVRVPSSAPLLILFFLPVPQVLAVRSGFKNPNPK
jgi:hypothetical protein